MAKGKKDKKSKKQKQKRKEARRSKVKQQKAAYNFGTFGLPMGVMADSYKAVHFMQYPDANKMSAYGEFRKPYRDFVDGDSRFVVFGIRYLVETYLLRRWTLDDVERAKAFYATHNSGHTAFPFPEDLFRSFIEENEGYFPISLEALPEGTVAHVRTPVYVVTARRKYARLVTFFETLLTHVWYTCTVATLSRKCRDILADAFERSVDDDAAALLDSRLHDFGFRGTTSLQQAVLGGSAHLLSFSGSDTMAAGYHAQYDLNGGRPVATSIPATEHSVMTSWPSERAAIEHVIRTHGDGAAFACVMDTYDYTHAITSIMRDLKELKLSYPAYMVYRPDSGDVVDSVLEGLRAAEATFGATLNAKGYKMLQGVGVIQGDGINVKDLGRIVDAVMDAGYSAANVAFGMGSGLLHKVNRDTMSFATKLSYIRYADGSERDVMKKPKTDPNKFSLPGALKVVRNAEGVPIVYPKGVPAPGKKLLKLVYDCGPVEGLRWPSFDKMRRRVQAQWDALPPTYDNLSPELRHKIRTWHEIDEKAH